VNGDVQIFRIRRAGGGGDFAAAAGYCLLLDELCRLGATTWAYNEFGTAQLGRPQAQVPAIAPTWNRNTAPRGRGRGPSRHLADAPDNDIADPCWCNVRGGDRSGDLESSSGRAAGSPVLGTSPERGEEASVGDALSSAMRHISSRTAGKIMPKIMCSGGCTPGSTSGWVAK